MRACNRGDAICTHGHCIRGGQVSGVMCSGGKGCKPATMCANHWMRLHSLLLLLLQLLLCLLLLQDQRQLMLMLLLLL